MDVTVYGLPWGEFAQALKAQTLKAPFLVREVDPAGKSQWFLYALSPLTLVQVLTFTRKARFWRTVDGALSDLERELGDLPALTVYGSVEQVALESFGVTS
jgi:hypothetical protein